MKYATPLSVNVPAFFVLLFMGGQTWAEMEEEVDRQSSHLSLKLRNYYQDRQLKDYSDNYKESIPGGERTIRTHARQKAWGQGLEINFESASLGNEYVGVGFDFSLYGGLKLTGKEDLYGTTVLKEGEPYFDAGQHRYLAKQDSYGKVGLANIKFFGGNDDYNLKTKAGWIPIEKPLLQTYYRLTPTSFQGVITDIQLKDFNVYGAWTDKVSMYNWEKIEKFTSTQSGSEGRHSKHEAIDHIYTVGGSYESSAGFAGDLAYAESESYLKLHFVRLKYTIALSEENALLLDGQYYQGNENGNKWRSGNTSYGGFDKDAHLYNLNAKLNFSMLTFLASFTQVKAEKKGGLGHFDGHLAYDAGNDFDDLDYWTKRQLSDFNYNGEKTWQAGVKYAFDNVELPGLSLGYTYTQGCDIEATELQGFTDKYKESEHNVELVYAFQQPDLKGLQLTVLYAWNKSDKELSQIGNEDKKGYAYEGRSDIRVYVDYLLKVF